MVPQARGTEIEALQAAINLLLPKAVPKGKDKCSQAGNFMLQLSLYRQRHHFHGSR